MSGDPPAELTTRLEAELLARCGRRDGSEIYFTCPFPEKHTNGDSHPSARYNTLKHVWHCDPCGAGGGARELAGLLGVSTERKREPRREVAAYSYTNEAGELLYEVVRYAPKGFRQRRPDGRGGWVWNLNGVRRVLFRLPETLTAVAAGRTICIAEGCKDVLTLVGLGLDATCNPGGAGKWGTSYSEALRGARVVIIADADKPGREHAQAVATALHGIAAEVKVVELPGAKDVTEWHDRCGGTREQLEKLVAASPVWTLPTADAADAGRDAGPYTVRGNRLVHLRTTRDGSVPVILANFAARIVEEIVRDDGAERSLVLSIEGCLEDGETLPRLSVPAAQFAALNWATAGWGSRAVIAAGQGVRDHLRAAIQLTSGNVPRRTVYAQLGWRHLGGGWAYLHAVGAIGATGPVAGVEVDPPAALTGYVLPDPPEGDVLREAVRAQLGLLDVAPARVTVPLVGAVFRAPLCSVAEPGESLHVTGPTGAGKTSLAALGVASWGCDPSPRRTSATWHSTPNALERLAHAAADALLLVDDYAPGGGREDIARLGRDAERLLRAAGNRQGRGRMGPDGSLRPTYAPRGLIISTGEDVPRGQSLRARLLIVEVAPGEVDWQAVTATQAAARDGSYARAMAGYLRWLAGRLDALRKSAPAELRALRDAATREAMHRRTPDSIAALAWGWQVWLRFAVEASALSQAEAGALWSRVWAALGALGEAQAEHLAAADPVGRFFALLGGAFASGRAHVEDARGGAPSAAERWGWRATTVRGQDGAEVVYRAAGRRIGWVAGAELLLDPEAAFAEVQLLARDQGETLPITPLTLWRRLAERGELLGGDAEHLTVKRTVGGDGTRRRVLVLGADRLDAEHCPGLRPGSPGHLGATGARTSQLLASKAPEAPEAPVSEIGHPPCELGGSSEGMHTRGVSPSPPTGATGALGDNSIQQSTLPRPGLPISTGAVPRKPGQPTGAPPKEVEV